MSDQRLLMNGNACMTNIERIICVKSVRALTSFSRSTMFRKIAEGTSSWQIRTSVHRIGWREFVINCWTEIQVGYRKTGAEQ